MEIKIAVITIKSQYLRVLAIFLATLALVSCGQSGGSDDGSGNGQGNKVTAQAIEITLEEDMASDLIDVMQQIDDASYSLASITQPTHGTATINADGLIEYQPEQDYSGDDTFAYTITNGAGEDLTANIVVHVTPVNDPPVAVDDELTVEEDAEGAVVPVLNNDTDVESDTLTVSIDAAGLQLPQSGQITLTNNGDVLYTPNANAFGVDTFQYQVMDVSSASAVATVDVAITPMPDAPVAVAGGPYTVSVNSLLSPDGSQSYDLDGDTLSYLWDFGDGSAANGVNPNKTYSVPGQYTIQLIVNDGTTNSEPGSTVVNVVAAAPFITQQPLNASIQDGGITTFSVQALGNMPLQYQWRRNGANIPGASNQRYTTPPITMPADVPSHTIEYDVVFSNDVGQVVSNVATLTVNANPPVIVTSPQSQSVQDQQQLTLSAAAQGSANLHYQWRKDGVPISGATASNYIIPQVTYGENEGNYDVVVTNIVGTATSSSAQIMVQPQPVVIINPSAPLVIDEGETALFTVVVEGSEPISYQWQFNNVDIPDATLAQYEITSAALADSGDYRVVVTNPAGSVNGPTVPLTVNKLPPEIVTQPTPIVVFDRGSASFTVVAQDSEPLSYQWRRNGVDMPAENSPTLLLTVVSMADDGDYFSVEVSNSAVSTVSQAVPLGVLPAAPQIVAQPGNVSIYEGNNAMFIVGATGTAPFNYQWRRNGDNIPGATNAFYNVLSTQLTNNGESYDVIVTNDSGSVTSNSAILTVLSNATPQAVRDEAVTRKNNTVTIDVLSNDTDTDGDILLIQSATNGALGDVTVISGTPDTLQYTPQFDQVGKDIFTYTVDDGKGKTAVGEVVVHVNPWGAIEIIGNGEGPSLASSTEHGDSFLTWRSGSNSASSIWGTRYVAGDSWIIPQVPFASGVLLNNQQVHASYFGAAYVLWQNTNTQTGVQFLQHAEWNGLDWVLGSVERPITNVLDSISNLTFTTNNNTRFSAVWLETDVVSGNKRVAWSYALDITQYITDGSSDVDEPVMAVSDNNTPVFIWKDIDTGNLLWRYGVTAIQPANDVLNERGNNIRQPQIALNGNGQGMIAWLYDSNSTVLQTRSISVTDSSTEPELGSALSHPLGQNVLETKMAVAENGDVVIVWSQQEGDGSSIWIKRITASNEVIEKLSRDPALQPANPDVSINSNGLISVVWEERGNAVSRRFEANGVWSQVENLDNAYAGNSSHVVVDSTDNGQVTSAWQRDNGEIVASIASIDFADVTPLPVNHTALLAGSCNNAGCHTLHTGHIATTAECDSCHFNTSWKPVIVSTDRTTMRICSSCHDNVIEQGKSDSHIAVSFECNVCHTMEAWIPANAGGVPDHSTFVGNCITCHNGTTASGKTAGHINTTNLCDACHQAFPANWAPLVPSAVDHSQVIGICSSCHNNVIATGKPVIHSATTNLCDACHYVPPSSWRTTINPIDHAEVVGTCYSCHLKPVDHPATSDSCEACHNVPPTQWISVANTFSHNDAFDACATCHTLPGAHCAPAGSCDDCHSTISWNAFADCPIAPPSP
jgi:hypothetical protein